MHEEVKKYLSERGRKLWEAKKKKYGKKKLRELLSKAGKTKKRKGYKQVVDAE